jgi:alkylation response protein AidB-like acyl-CoA dehydrogenase
MSTTTTPRDTTERTTDFVATASTLGPVLAERAAGHDTDGSFVADNYDDLRAHRLFSAGIPTELGGGGASYRELCDVIRELGRHCGSTALSFAMHTHPVATNIYKHLHGDERATAALSKIAAGELVIAGTGANDWLKSSGEAERVEGGFRVRAHKHFVSGGPGAQIFVSSVAYSGEGADEVLHFAIPFDSDGLRTVKTWNSLGMRGTGSHDLLLEDVFVPDEAVVLRRTAEGWHPMWNVIIPTALPLITAAYVGLAERAAELAVKSAKKRGPAQAQVVGEMFSALAIARMSLKDMIGLNRNHGFTPGLALADDILTRKAVAADALKNTVELAAEIVGGAGFFRGHPVERIVRDVRAIQFHPLPSRRQREFSGRVALGLDPIA